MSTIDKLASCEDPFDHLLPVDEARQRLLDTLQPVAFEKMQQVPLADASGRVLAQAITAPFDVPPEANSAMDGYAIVADDIPTEGETRLRIVGTAWAGRPYGAAVARGEAVRIFTGAVMPAGADTVVIQEHVRADEQSVHIDSKVVPGRNVRAAGEDVALGELVFDEGRRLTAPAIGVLASLGIVSAGVRERLRVAWFTTGDELVSLDKAASAVDAGTDTVSIGPPGTGLLYDSNRHTLRALLSRAGVQLIDLGVVPDTLEATRDALTQAAAQADLVISSGGVSTGDADYVKQAFHELGEVAFWRLAMRPGRPLAFGRVGEATFFGLPGNPVAVVVTFLQFVLPALRRLSGESADALHPMAFPATCLSRLRTSLGRTEFQRGVMRTDETGRVVVESTGAQGAGRLSSMSAANCLIMIAPECGAVEPGDQVHVQPLYGLMP